MKAAAVLVILSMAVGEWLAPQGEAAAREIRAQAISGGSLISSKSGVWAKDGDYFVHISEVADTGTLKQVQIYRFDNSLKLKSWSAASKATYQDDAWLLHDVKNTEINDMAFTTEIAETQLWRSTLTPEKLGVVTVKPEALSIQGLVEYLEYLKSNDQDPSRYELAFWRKVVQPFTVGVMLLLALSFIFGPLRSMSMGARIVMGVATGIVFYLVNQVAGSISLVYQLPPVLGAILPSIIFVSVAVFYMNKRA